MSLKTYGIYIAYAPTIDLRSEGLGRYLASFIQGTRARTDVDFVLVCPSWSRHSLEELFESEAISHEKVRIMAPAGKPYLLRVYEAYQAYRRRPRTAGLRQRFAVAIKSVSRWLLDRLELRLAQAHGFMSLFFLAAEGSLLSILLILLSPLLIPILLVQAAQPLIKAVKRRLVTRLHPFLQRYTRLVERPKDDGWVMRLFAIMNETEARRMNDLIDGLKGISAWYAPAAFWPAFTRINAPRLMCVPDVVLGDFAVSFSSMGGDRFLDTFENIRTAVRAADHMVTYSESVKWDTLVDRYGVSTSRVSVIHHAPNTLDRWIRMDGLQNAESASRHYCQTLLLRALPKATNPRYAAGIQTGQIRFLFYASQVRPNKNVLTLLKAYEFLLRRRYIGLKLILTGNPKEIPEIEKFIADNRLENDVLFLRGLSVPELAACYKLADLAVNPSLSEGGCPFTFTEALSVGTPVVMARIPVTEEILSDPALQEVTFFDPYRWDDLAKRIEWALENREDLLAVQMQTYKRLVQRTWTDVANEHITLLEKISQPSPVATGV